MLQSLQANQFLSNNIVGDSMAPRKFPSKIFSSAGEDVSSSKLVADTPQTRSPSYQLAYTDDQFMLRDDLRPVRLQLELLKPDLIQDEHMIHSTVVIFGSSRIPEPAQAQRDLAEAEQSARNNPEDLKFARKVKVCERILDNSRYYDEARQLGQLITEHSRGNPSCDLTVITGGGPGIMEAANRGAADVGGRSIGLNIVLPFEQRPNLYITPELCFQFHYFAIRKMQFLMRAKALVACPGGFGTLDEVFEALTLIQTKKITPVPVLLMGRDYWQSLINFQLLVDEGVISESDLELFQFVDSASEAWDIIKNYYEL